jgi:3-deoxy-D-manno-octulosonic-acid transferase
MIWVYRGLQLIFLPLLVLWFVWRLLRGKEDPKRFTERLGRPSVARPKGKLLWLHCASVGESLSIQPLIAQLRKTKPRLNILVTTGTRSSAALMAKHLPKGVIHQYVPVDAYPCVQRFMRHWHPSLSLFVESELWPELLAAAPHATLINARMSDRSWRRYKRVAFVARWLLAQCEAVLCQSPTDVERFKHFTPQAALLGNLKYDFPPLSVDQKTLQNLQKQIGTRPVVVMASTHSREEAMAVRWQLQWQQQVKDVLVVIIPRHPERVKDFVNLLPPGAYGLRSRDDRITAETKFYVGDTFGEMGLWFRLASVIVMGGSFVTHGGHNPLEPLKLNKPVFVGPHMFNFRDMTQVLTRAGLIRQVPNEATLMQELNLKALPQPNAKALAALEGATLRGVKYITDKLEE